MTQRTFSQHAFIGILHVETHDTGLGGSITQPRSLIHTFQLGIMTDDMDYLMHDVCYYKQLEFHSIP